MSSGSPADLSRRERQFMDILYRSGQATAAEVMSQMDDAPTYSGVRALLRILVQKGHVTHEQDGPRYLYRAVLPKERARVGALKQVVQTFFGGSAEQAMAALIDSQGTKLSSDELERIAKLVERARKEGR